MPGDVRDLSFRFYGAGARDMWHFDRPPSKPRPECGLKRVARRLAAMVTKISRGTPHAG